MNKILSLIRRVFRKINQIIFRKDKLRFIKYLSQHKYEEATIQISKKNMNKEKSASFIRDYATACYYAGKHKEANKYSFLAFEKVFKDERNEHIINEVNFLIKNNKAEYKSLGGFSNFGFIIVDNKLDKEIVKIIDNSKGLKELLFYKKYKGTILENNLVYNKHIKGTRISLLYMPYVEGVKPKNEHLKLVLDLHEKIIDVTYPYNSKEINNNNFYSNVMHEKGVIENEIKNIIKGYQKNKYNQVIIDDLEQLLQNIRNTKFYEKINVEKHYYFTHNDFHKNNMLVTNDKLVIYDWNSYNSSSYGIDMAYYLGRFEFTFYEIEKYYVERIRKKVDNISIILYYLQQIIIWNKRLHGKNPMIFYNDYFKPIINKTNKMIFELS